MKEKHAKSRGKTLANILRVHRYTMGLERDGQPARLDLAIDLDLDTNSIADYAQILEVVYKELGSNRLDPPELHKD